MTTFVYGVQEIIRAARRGRQVVSSSDGELWAEVERLRADKTQLEEGIALLMERIRATTTRLREQEEEAARLQIELDIEKRINNMDRIGDMRTALQKMATAVNDARLERDAAKKEAKESLKQLEDVKRQWTKPRTPRPGRVQHELRDTRHIGTPLRLAVIERDGGCCRYCGQKIERGSEQIDHVYPHSMGGQTVIENLVLSCLYCNMIKGDQIGVWPRSLAQEPTP